MEKTHPCDLGGLDVLVTRPSGQADGLCAAIEAAGGRPVRFPAIEIVAAAGPGAIQRLGDRAQYDWLIFVSANAVIHAQHYLALEPTKKVAAVGQATADALEDAGVSGVVVPAASSDSEGLLAEPDMAVVSGQRILIVRGSGGRSLLGDTLQSRGAQVEYAEVYRREPPPVGRDELRALDAHPPGAVTTTSGEILQNLITLFGPGSPLLAVPLVVVSPRVAEMAARAGFSRIATADGAGDDAIVTALCDLCGRPPPDRPPGT